jgi:hypothetical protein
MRVLLIVFKTFLNVGNMGNFWKQAYFIIKHFKNSLCDDNFLFIIHINRKLC